MAFSPESRRVIFERDGGVSARSGVGGPLHASHFDHTKGTDIYNNPDNGVMLTRAEHFIEHYFEHGRNGLSESQNLWAMETLWKNMPDSEKQAIVDCLAIDTKPNPYAIGPETKPEHSDSRSDDEGHL